MCEIGGRGGVILVNSEHLRKSFKTDMTVGFSSVLLWKNRVLLCHILSDNSYKLSPLVNRGAIWQSREGPGRLKYYSMVDIIASLY